MKAPFSRRPTLALAASLPATPIAPAPTATGYFANLMAEPAGHLAATGGRAR